MFYTFNVNTPVCRRDATIHFPHNVTNIWFSLEQELWHLYCFLCVVFMESGCDLVISSHRWVRHFGGFLPDNSSSFRKSWPTNLLKEEVENKSMVSANFRERKCFKLDCVVKCELVAFQKICSKSGSKSKFFYFWGHKGF